MAERGAESLAVAASATRAAAAAAEPQELSLEQILRLYNQPLNEEQAWAVCYQCCRALRRCRSPSCSLAADGHPPWGRLCGAGAVLLHRDGNISIRGDSGKNTPPQELLLIIIIIGERLRQNRCSTR